jgi:phenylacetate-CoA ligase
MSLMDVARGAYVRSPTVVRRSLAPLVALVPTRAKFGSTYRKWRERVALADADPGFAADQHVAALRALLLKAHAGSPFYRAAIDAAFGPDFDLATAEPADLLRLPVLGKAELAAAGDAVLAVPRSTVDAAETSGSNAERPFSFYLDKDRSAREMAFVYDVWSHVGYDEEQSRACFRGFGLDPKGLRIHEWEPALRELKLSVFPMTAEDAGIYLDLIDQRGIQYLYGYLSALELFCRHLQVLGRQPKLPIKGIMPISEPIYEHQRRRIRQVLGDVPFACFYGLSEKVLFAAELPGRPGVYAFNPLYGLAELVDAEGEPVVEPGRTGRLVGTGFLTTGMPFIRYDTGDSACLVELPTPANGQRLVVEGLVPRRKPDYLVASNGNRVVTIDLTPEDPRLFGRIQEFQFYQDTPGEVVIRYIPAPGTGSADAEKLAAYLDARTHGDIRFSVAEVERIAAGRDGKRAFIDQRLDFNSY